MDTIALLDVRPDGRVPHDFHTRCALLNQKDGGALMNRCLGVGHNHHQEKRREARVGGKPFFTVNDPLITITRRGTQELSGIGTSLRLSHGIARGDFRIEQGFEVFFFLFRSTELGENLSVAGIRRLTAKNAGTEATAPENFVHQAEADLTITLPSEIGLQVTRPETFFFHYLSERCHRGKSG